MNPSLPKPTVFVQASDIKVDPSIKARCSQGDFRAEHLFHIRLAYLAAKKTACREITPVPEGVEEMTQRYLSGKGSMANDGIEASFLSRVIAVDQRALATNFAKVDMLVESIVQDPKKVPGTVQSLGMTKQKSGTLGLGVVYEMIFPGDTVPKPVQVKPEILKGLLEKKA